MAGTCRAQTDPGPRSGAAGAGGAFTTLNANELNFFTQALARFQEVDSVSGTISGEDGLGLGPTFNGNSCAMCHAQPAIGGSSPGLTSPQNPVANPQVALATKDGATNTVPTFITSSGPVREARFFSDGGVHDLYTIQGRSDASGCTLAQPNFAAQITAGTISYRIPTPLFGLGLVENTTDANLRSAAGADTNLGINPIFNISGNDGTITRFGWKAQNKSLLIFSGEAYNVEQGVTNENFPNERSTVSGCVFNATPEDASNILNPNSSSPNFGTTVGTVAEMSSDIVDFGAFMRLLAAPTPTTSFPTNTLGKALFENAGCAVCHVENQVAAASPFTGLSNVSYSPFSDFALHHMGSTLADGITQGLAGPDQFRTAPLWGLGQRLFFLHDGRTTDLLQAILDHYSPPPPGVSCTPPISPPNASCPEGNISEQRFAAFTTTQKQAVLNYLRTL
jgi:CxxC motif-containing protein (DUF1111 family)